MGSRVQWYVHTTSLILADRTAAKRSNIFQSNTDRRDVSSSEISTNLHSFGSNDGDMVSSWCQHVMLLINDYAVIFVNKLLVCICLRSYSYKSSMFYSCCDGTITCVCTVSSGSSLSTNLARNGLLYCVILPKLISIYIVYVVSHFS